VQNKLNKIKAPLARIAANAQLAIPRCWFLLNAVVCGFLVKTIGYIARCADCAFGRQMLPNAAKCCKNAGKFFPDVNAIFYSLPYFIYTK